MRMVTGVTKSMLTKQPSERALRGSPFFVLIEGARLWAVISGVFIMQALIAFGSSQEKGIQNAAGLISQPTPVATALGSDVVVSLSHRTARVFEHVLRTPSPLPFITSLRGE